ncbi:MAG: hypothetical protein ACK463_26935, partial [Bradyrhizobium sp.]
MNVLCHTRERQSAFEQGRALELKRVEHVLRATKALGKQDKPAGQAAGANAERTLNLQQGLVRTIDPETTVDGAAPELRIQQHDAAGAVSVQFPDHLRQRCHVADDQALLPGGGNRRIDRDDIAKSAIAIG